MERIEKPVFAVLLAICFCHGINDLLQSLLVATYPTIKSEFHLTFAQIGLLTMAYQLTASFLQPAVGLLADRRPMPFSLPVGTLFTFAGLSTMSVATSYPSLLAGACVLGVGSSVFHPESSRVARMAGGSRPGLAQSLFQVGGNAGSALGPVGAAIVVLRWGRHGLQAFATLSMLSTLVLFGVSLWVRRHGLSRLSQTSAQAARGESSPLSPASLGGPLFVLMVLVFSKFVYLSSFSSYYTFYLIRRFGVSVRTAELLLFAILASAAFGTFAGGPLGDRFGRKRVIWLSILGVLPFTVLLPYANLFWTGVLSVLIGSILASAFPAIVVYGQELIPGRVGMVSGLFFGLSFGAAGAGAALLGKLADSLGVEAVYRLTSFLPALGLLAAFLPNFEARAPGSAVKISRPDARPEEAL